MPGHSKKPRRRLHAFLGGAVLCLLSGLLLSLMYGVCMTDPASPTYYMDKLNMLWSEAGLLASLVATVFISGLTLMIAAAVYPLFREPPHDESDVHPIADDLSNGTPACFASAPRQRADSSQQKIAPRPVHEPQHRPVLLRDLIAHHLAQKSGALKRRLG